MNVAIIAASLGFLGIRKFYCNNVRVKGCLGFRATVLLCMSCCHVYLGFGGSFLGPRNAESPCSCRLRIS